MENRACETERVMKVAEAEGGRKGDGKAAEAEGGSNADDSGAE